MAIVFNKDKFSNTLNIISRQPNQLNHNEFISETQLTPEVNIL